MAGEEKKKPDLKSRLKRTEVGQTAPAFPNPSDPGIAPPMDLGQAGPAAAPAMMGGEIPNIAPPMDFGAPIVPGLGDIAPPEFIRQQQQARAEAEARAAAESQARIVAEARAAAIAAAASDPFGSSSMQHSPQEVRLVIDEKSVSDAEVGRKNTGVVFGIVATGVVMLGAGYLMGGFIEQRSQANRTVAALADIRRSVDEAGAAITMLKDKLDRAATSAGIGGAPGEPSAPAGQVAANARIDTDLPTWFLQQPPDPPLTADAYANRVGRLRPDLVNKLMKTQIELAVVWTDMRRHSERTQHDAALITASLHDAQTARGELARLMVVFGHGPANGPPVMGTIVGYSAGEGLGPYTIAPALPGGPPTRTIYTEGDLSTAALLGTVAIPVSATAGTPSIAVRGMGQPWSDYANRLRALKTLVDELANDHHSLAEALSH